MRNIVEILSIFRWNFDEISMNLRRSTDTDIYPRLKLFLSDGVTELLGEISLRGQPLLFLLYWPWIWRKFFGLSVFQSFASLLIKVLLDAKCPILRAKSIITWWYEAGLPAPHLPTRRFSSALQSLLPNSKVIRPKWVWSSYLTENFRHLRKYLESKVVGDDPQFPIGLTGEVSNACFLLVLCTYNRI